jgi:TRAP transporter 4TM/12TM fusion protein
LAVVLTIHQVFILGRATGVMLLENAYLYWLLACLLPLAFFVFPLTIKGRWIWPLDLLMALATAGILGYFAWNAETMVRQAWEYTAPEPARWASLLLWFLVMEVTRRAGGLAILIVVGVLSFYPVYAASMPGVFSGFAMTVEQTGMYHIMSTQSMLGLPIKAFASLVVGFLLFGVTLQFTGAGRFFLDMSFALLGHVRGGAAKVAVFASGLMGSMSGSVTSNVLTTGTLTIPAMTKSGFPRLYAAGIEACASTGGTLMPPIMGATAFVMANFLGISYLEVATAAIIPSVLYFFGLFIGADAFAAKAEIKGLPQEELPSLRKAMREGWYYIAVFAFLIWMLIGLGREAAAPFYATGLLLVINQVFSKRDRMTWDRFKSYLLAVGRLLVEIAAILAGIGLVVGALVVTGMIGGLTNALVHIAGGSVLALLVMGALASFILGIGMTVTAAYVFLAVVLAPSLIQAGLNPLAVHMFILYWGMLSFITPPVAIGAFAAASVARTSPMRTGFKAVQLGAIIYFVPFFFVLNPALLLIGTPQEIISVTVSAIIGVAVLANGLQGYIYGIGPVTQGPIGWVVRGLMIVGGLAFAAPGLPMAGIGPLVTSAIGAGFAVLALILAWITQDKAASPLVEGQTGHDAH